MKMIRLQANDANRPEQQTHSLGAPPILTQSSEPWLLAKEF